MIDFKQPDHSLDTNVADVTPNTGVGATGPQANANQVNPTNVDTPSTSQSQPVAAPEGVSAYVQTATDGKSDNPITDATLAKALNPTADPMHPYFAKQDLQTQALDHPPGDAKAVFFKAPGGWAKFNRAYDGWTQDPADYTKYPDSYFFPATIPVVKSLD